MSVLDRYIVRAILSSVLLVMLGLLVLGALFVFIGQQADIVTGHYTALGASVREGALILNVAGRYSQRQFGGMQILELSKQHRLIALGHATRATAGSRGKWLLSDYTESRFADDAVTTRPTGQRLLASNVTAGFLGLAVEDPKQLTSRALWRLINHYPTHPLHTPPPLFPSWSPISPTLAIP